MATDDRTPIQNFPRPHIDNTVAEDFARIITLVNLLEAKISALDGQVAGKAAVDHAHAIAGIAGLQAALDGKQSAAWRPALGDLSNVNVTGAVNGQLLGLVGTAWQPMTLSVAWGNVSGKPSSFPTTWDDVAGKPATFTPSGHSHPISEISNLQPSLDANAAAAAAKLPLAGGQMSGDVRYPTDIKVHFKRPDGSTSWGTGAWIYSYGSELYIDSHDGPVVFRRGGWVQTLKLHADGNVDIGVTRINPADGGVEINQRGNGDRPAYADFHAYGGPAAADWAARIIRNAGVNGFLDIINSGSGVIRIYGAYGTYVESGLPDQQNAIRAARQGGGIGGALYLQKPNTSSLAGDDVFLRMAGNTLQILESGGGYRGLNADLSACQAGASSAITHSGNFAQHVIAGDTQDIGKYVFAYCNANGVNFGGSVAGNFLQPGSHASYQAGTINGTWRAQGLGNTGHITLWQRIA